MARYKVAFNFDVDFECEEEDIKDAVTMWWNDCLEVPEFTVTGMED
jgi:hypothetical protein